MILSQPDMGDTAPRYRIPVSTPANRARFVAALMLPGAFALVPRAAQANPFVDLTWLSGFGKNGTSFEAATAVAIDPIRGEIAIANSGRGRIEILSADGKASAFFEHRVWRPDGSYVLGQPRGLRYDAAGHLLVTDNLDSGVDVLDFRGRVIGRLRIPVDGKPGAAVDTNEISRRIHHHNTRAPRLGRRGGRPDERHLRNVAEPRTRHRDRGRVVRVTADWRD